MIKGGNFDQKSLDKLLQFYGLKVINVLIASFPNFINEFSFFFYYTVIPGITEIRFFYQYNVWVEIQTNHLLPLNHCF